MRGVATTGAIVVALFAPSARAQAQATPTAPLILKMPAPSGDARGSMTDGETRAWLEPLRLSLSGASLGLGRFHAGCATREATPSTSFLQAIAPKLSLFGATSGGCPLDDVGTAGIAFATPLGSRAWLVLTTSLFSIPLPDATRRQSADVNAKIVLPNKDRKTGYSIGIGTRGLMFGGLW